jgi:hypothetical protein
LRSIATAGPSVMHFGARSIAWWNLNTRDQLPILKTFRRNVLPLSRCFLDMSPL